MFNSMQLIFIQVILTTRNSRRWALSALATICPAAYYRGADFGGKRYVVPWQVRILRLFLPQAPGTETSLYKRMMAGVVARIEKPYRIDIQHHSNGGLNEVVDNGYDFMNDSPFSQKSGDNVAYCTGNITVMMDIFNAWNNYVKSIVPSNRLLVFEIGKDGWQELATFLNVSLSASNEPRDAGPSKPFPTINTREDYHNMMIAQKFLASLLIVSLSLSFILLVVAVWYYCCRRKGLAESAYDDILQKSMFDKIDPLKVD